MRWWWLILILILFHFPTSAVQVRIPTYAECEAILEDTTGALSASAVTKWSHRREVLHVLVRRSIFPTNLRQFLAERMRFETLQRLSDEKINARVDAALLLPNACYEAWQAKQPSDMHFFILSGRYSQSSKVDRQQIGYPFKTLVLQLGNGQIALIQHSEIASIWTELDSN